VGRRAAGVWAALVAAVAVGAIGETAAGQPPVYQRTSSAAYGPDWGRGHRGNDFRRAQPQVSAGWFQRPYPYHLDYYRMRYGGSYAPYFGNLYGPPNVVLAPPYYGGYGYGGYEPYPGGYGYPPPGEVAPPPGYVVGSESGDAVVGPPVGYPARPTANASELPPSDP